MDQAKNFAKGSLSAAINDTDTSLTVQTGEGSKFPAAPFNAVIWNATDFPDPADDPFVEIVRVTSKSTDTFTVTRGQEGTSGITHNTEGKIYKLLAGPTAKLVNEHILPASITGDDWGVSVPGSLQIDAVDAVVINSGVQFRANPSAAGVVVDLAGGVAAMGDVDGNNTGAAISADDNTGRIKLQGILCTDQSASATTPGTVVKKLQIFDLSGNSLGFIPIYNSIT